MPRAPAQSLARFVPASLARALPPQASAARHTRAAEADRPLADCPIRSATKSEPPPIFRVRYPERDTYSSSPDSTTTFPNQQKLFDLYPNKVIQNAKPKIPWQIGLKKVRRPRVLL